MPRKNLGNLDAVYAEQKIGSMQHLVRRGKAEPKLQHGDCAAAETTDRHY